MCFLEGSIDYPTPGSVRSREIAVPSPSTIHSFMSSPGHMPFTSPNIR